MVTLIGSDGQRAQFDRIDTDAVISASDGESIVTATWETGEVETMIVKLNVPLTEVLMDGWKQQ